MEIKNILFNKNFWLGIVWFIIVWFGTVWITSLMGNKLPDEYMGTIVEIGIALFVLGIISSFIINRYKKKFAWGFFLALVIELFVMFLE